jgi:hypothetical protein
LALNFSSTYLASWPCLVLDLPPRPTPLLIQTQLLSDRTHTSTHKHACSPQTHVSKHAPSGSRPGFRRRPGRLELPSRGQPSAQDDAPVNARAQQHQRDSIRKRTNDTLYHTHQDAVFTKLQAHLRVSAWHMSISARRAPSGAPSASDDLHITYLLMTHIGAYTLARVQAKGSAHQRHTHPVPHQTHLRPPRVPAGGPRRSLESAVRVLQDLDMTTSVRRRLIVSTHTHTRAHKGYGMHVCACVSMGPAFVQVGINELATDSRRAIMVE